MKKKALLIDLDGTLIDTLPALYQVYEKFMAKYGKKASKEEFKSLVGPSIDEIVKTLKAKHNLKESVDELSNYYVSILMLQGFDGTALFPHAKETLDQLKDKGVKLALVTSGTKTLVKQCLEPLKLNSYFDLIVTADDVHKAKPDPELYKTALKKLAIAASEAIALEDSAAGIKSAEDAGLDVIAITHEHSDLPPLKKSVVCLKDWKEIGKWLLQK